MNIDQPPYGLYRAPRPPPSEPRASVVDAWRFAFGTLRERPSLVLILAALQMVPILGPLVMAGLMAYLFQRLVRRDTTPLPMLRGEDIGLLCRRGLPGLLAQLAFGVFGVFCIFVPMMFTPLFMLTKDTTAIGVGVGFSLLFVLCTNVLMYILLGASLTRAEATESIDATFSLAAVWDYGRRMGTTLAWGMLAMTVIFIPLMFLGMMCLFFGAYIAVVLYGLAGAHYRWQVYERYLWMGGAPLILAGTPPHPQPSVQ